MASTKKTAKKSSASRGKWHDILYSKYLTPAIFIFAFGVGGAYYLATSHALTPAVNITAGQMSPSAFPYQVKLPYLTQEKLTDKNGKIVYDLPSSNTGPVGAYGATAVSYKFHVNPTVKTTYQICTSFRRDRRATKPEGIKIDMLTSFHSPGGGSPNGDLSSKAELSAAGTDKYIYSCAPERDFYPRIASSSFSGYDITARVSNINAVYDLRVANIVLALQKSSPPGTINK